MTLSQSILRKLGLNKPKPAVPRSQAMQVRPLRNPKLEWDHNEEGLVVVVLTRRTGLLGRSLSFLLAVPETRPIVLDEVGSFVWDRCDGEHTVADLAQALRQEYNLDRREVEVSLVEYLRLLGKRGMIAVAVPRELMAQLDEATKKALGVTETSESSPENAGKDSSAEDEGSSAKRPSRSSHPGPD